jgi:hypothetical protein
LVVWELSLKVAETLNALDAQYVVGPPTTEVHAGSVSFSIGGSTTLIAGIGLMVAAHTAIPLGAASELAYWGGSLSAALGLFDAVINWYKTLKDVKKTDTEAALNQAKTRLTEIEIQKAQRELEPAAAYVPTEIIVSESRRFGVDAALGTHLINEVMPTLLDLRRSYPAPISVSSGSAKARSASRGA